MCQTFHIHYILHILFTWTSPDTPSRPSFRTTLSQPSQMGNFKHQSLRPNDRDRDRDRDRDADKERERDIRDKDGHERLRHVGFPFVKCPPKD